MGEPRFGVGIDLGTTNCAAATVELAGPRRAPEVLEIPQVVAAGEMGRKPLLPSFAYLPAGHELTQGALDLPWGRPARAVGWFARELGARAPDRLVSSAKSWLCHPGVDRTARILPWGAPSGVERISPVEASAAYLAHLRAAWEAAHPGSALTDQAVVLTVPASFDEGARELTLEAARAAGLPDVTLLEEPLAAFHHWLEGHEADLSTALSGVSTLLVVDVGGGTTDFTLVRVRRDEDGLKLDRTAVGDHLLLGGDNIDLAIARAAEARLGGGPLDLAAWGSLVHSARAAKEALLAEDAPASRSVIAVGRGPGLVGATRRAELSRDEVRSWVLEGFFPVVPPEARPERRAGLQAMGLPYAADPAITRHLAAFLARHLGPTQPVDAVLLNGGAMTPRIVAQRLLEAVASRVDGVRPRLLPNDQLDVAVARGAAHFCRVRRGAGVRVGGGSARAYFLGVRTAAGPQGVCVVPMGSEEGERVPLEHRAFELTVGRPVRFELFSSTSRRATRPGQLVALEGPGAEDLVRLPPIQTVIRAAPAATGVEVRVEAGVTELGTLALWCVAGAERYKLEFQLRGGLDDGVVHETAALPRRFGEARELIDKFYGKKPSEVDPREVKNLGRALEKALGERETWSLPALRELWAVLWGAAQRRRRSAEHERQWLMLAGYALRPGFGAALDDWRVKETFGIFAEGLQFHQDKAQWDQWWIFWRRIAGGLDEVAQTAIAEAARYWLEPVPAGRSRPRPKGPKADGLEELSRLVASLERLAPSLKREAGEWLWSRVVAKTAGASGLWGIGRIGARAPFHGSAHLVLPPADAEEWLGRLFKLDWAASRDAAFAAALIARATGDRACDVGDAVRGEVVDRLARAKAPPAWAAMVREPLALGRAEEQRIFGESLPPGLALLE